MSLQDWPQGSSASRSCCSLCALGFYEFGVSANSSTLLYSSLLYVFAFLVVGLAEETLFRGCLRVELSRVISFSPAAIVLSIVFGLPHWLKGGGEPVLGGIQASLFCLAMAYSFRVTGSLWFAIGAYTGWNYAESFIFGVPNSALVFDGRALHPSIHGPEWLTGGSAGPEGSVLALVEITLCLLIIRWIESIRHAKPITS